MPDRHFHPGIAVTSHPSGAGFIYGDGVFGPEAENRRLEDIRGSLLDPSCDGPEIVYSIAMDVGREKDRERLRAMHLLFGVVTYAAGKLGREPVRSQGHVHRLSPLSGRSTPEVYEIWSGKAVIYMQESAEDRPGRCYAVEALPGEVVIVPPGWVHATVSASPERPLTFGAWCDRAYGFVYDGVRRHRGIAWFPLYGAAGKLEWQANPHYEPSHLICKRPGDYAALGIRRDRPIYTTFEDNPETFRYVPFPAIKEEVWQTFEP
jgi:glucose-6-phosphate isomerase